MSFLLEHTFHTAISPLSRLMQLQRSVNGRRDWKWSGLGGEVKGREGVSQRTDNWYWCLRLNDNTTCWCPKQRLVSHVKLSWSFGHFVPLACFVIVLTIMNLFGGIYKQSACFSISYRGSMTTQRSNHWDWNNEKEKEAYAWISHSTVNMWSLVTKGGTNCAAVRHILQFEFITTRSRRPRDTKQWS